MYGREHIEWRARVAEQETIKLAARQKREEKRLRLRAKVQELSKIMRCNCDLDNWEPEPSTGHSWVCRIHKAATGQP